MSRRATGDGIKVVSQIREAGIDKRLITGYGSFQDPVYWDGTSGVVKGDYTWLAQDLTSPSAPLKTFLDKYNARFHAAGSDLVLDLRLRRRDGTRWPRLKKAGEPDRDKVAAAFADFDVTTSLGTRITFKNPPDGNKRQSSVVAIQITGPRQLRGSLMRYAAC